VHPGDSGARACEHYYRWESDLDLMQSLGVDAYRFSISWPRIIPDGLGAVNDRGLDYYDRLIDGLLARGIKVFPTLYHWDLPGALHERGGWTNRETVEAFAIYTEAVVKRLGDRMDALATFNEPFCSCYLGYLLGIHAPGVKDIKAAMRAVHHTNLAHGLGVQAALATRHELPMGCVLNAMAVLPGTDSPADVLAAERQFQFDNGAFFSPLFKGEYDAPLLAELGDYLPIESGDMANIQQPLDFWGLNYYCPVAVVDARKDASVFPHTRMVAATSSEDRTDIGWEIDANALTNLLVQLNDCYELPPCYITENGACYNMELDSNGVIPDEPRRRYLEDHIAGVAAAIDKGIDVRGYFAWSLLDNFEWAEGYSMRFGLVHVDYETQVRTIKQSGHWYADLMAAR